MENAGSDVMITSILQPLAEQTYSYAKEILHQMRNSCPTAVNVLKRVAERENLFVQNVERALTSGDHFLECKRTHFTRQPLG